MDISFLCHFNVNEFLVVTKVVSGGMKERWSARAVGLVRGIIRDDRLDLFLLFNTVV